MPSPTLHIALFNMTMALNIFVSKPRRLKALFACLLITVVTTVLTTTLHATQVFQRLEWISYDWHMAESRMNKPIPEDIAVILIDDASLQAMDGVVGRWPWPRSVYADLIEFIGYGEPKAIIFDLLFVESETAQSEQATNINDQRLIDATQEAQNVIHAMQFIANKEDEVNSTQADSVLPLEISNSLSINEDVLALTRSQSDKYAYNTHLIPINGLYQAASAIGVVSIESDRDGVLRRTPLILPYQGNYYPALSLASLLSAPGHEAQNTALIESLSEIPLDNDGNYLVNFYGQRQPYSASGILASLDMLKQGDVENLIVDPEEFAGKYVFIGASAIGLHDLKATPVAARLPGVMTHASVIGNILQKDFLHPPQTATTVLAIILLTIVSTLAVTIFRPVTLKVLIPLIFIGGYTIIVNRAFHHNQVIELIPPLFSIILGCASAYTFLLFTEGKERHKIRAMFSRYVSPAALAVMVDQYEDYVADATGSTETVTIFFSDIRGFTNLSETMSPQRVVEMLNHYFSSMTEAVFNHNGTIDKFIGDAIMAIWGAPVRSQSHAIDALAAAFEMTQRLQEVNTWLTTRGFEPIQIGIGLNTGPVVLGSIGSEHKADYTVIGDNVNLASRLEGLTKNYGCDILLSENTYQQLDGEVPCRVVDLVRVKGKQEPIRIFTPIVDGKNATQIAAISSQAFQHYLHQEWQQAAELYQQLPDDPITQLFQSRIASYQNHPPAVDWDGIHTMTTK